MDFPKLYIGPMSTEIVDVVIEYSNDNNVPLGLIPSRRQVEYDGGYTGFTTKSFSEYVKTKTNKVLLQRDHGGPLQGLNKDDGFESYKEDVNQNFDLFHIDPFKISDVDIDNTIQFLNMNDDIMFEVGTEEAIKKYSPTELDDMLNKLDLNKIKYAVIQSGTGLVGTKNIGQFDLNKLKEFINVCENHNLMSKEHNGDYLTDDEIKIRFDNGLSAINIAPEFGVLQTKVYLNRMSSEEKNRFFQICDESKKWDKWLIHDEDKSLKNKTIVSGHYNFTNEYINDIRLKNEQEVKDVIKKRIDDILEII